MLTEKIDKLRLRHKLTSNTTNRNMILMEYLEFNAVCSWNRQLPLHFHPCQKPLHIHWNENGWVQDDPTDFPGVGGVPLHKVGVRQDLRFPVLGHGIPGGQLHLLVQRTLDTPVKYQRVILVNFKQQS